MAKKKYDVCYGQKDKNDKVHWKQIGAVIQTDKGFSLKLETVPVGWDGWAVLYEPKAKEGAAPAKAQADSDDIPF